MKRAQNRRCTSSICEQSLGKVWIKKEWKLLELQITQIWHPKVLRTDGRTYGRTEWTHYWPAFAKATQVKRGKICCGIFPETNGHKGWLCLTAYRRLSGRRCLFCMTDINASHNILFMDILHIFYLPLHVISAIQNTNASLIKLVHICLCCKLDQRGTATFGFKKDGGGRSGIIEVKYLKGKKQKFDHLYLKSSQGTQGVAENMTVCNRCQFHDPWIIL